MQDYFIASRNPPMLASGMKALPRKAALACLRSRHGFATKYPANAKGGGRYEVSAACCGVIYSLLTHLSRSVYLLMV
jgi:hypothetical protein